MRWSNQNFNIHTTPPLPHSRASPPHLNFWRLDRSVLYSLHSMTKTNYAAKIPLTVQLLRKEKIHLANCHISSVQLFHLVQTRVFTGVSDFGARKKKAHLKPDNSGSIFYTRPRQRSNSPPQEGLTRQLSHSPDTENSQIPLDCRGGGGVVMSRSFTYSVCTLLEIYDCVWFRNLLWKTVT